VLTAIAAVPPPTIAAPITAAATIPAIAPPAIPETMAIKGKQSRSFSSHFRVVSEHEMVVQEVLSTGVEELVQL